MNFLSNNIHDFEIEITRKILRTSTNNFYAFKKV